MFSPCRVGWLARQNASLKLPSESQSLSGTFFFTSEVLEALLSVHQPVFAADFGVRAREQQMENAGTVRTLMTWNALHVKLLNSRPSIDSNY